MQKTQKRRVRVHKSTRFFLSFFLLMGIIVFPLMRGFAQEAKTGEIGQEEINKLNDEIRQRRQKVSDIESQKQRIQDQVDQKEEELATAQGQLSLVDNQIAITNLDISSTEEKISALRLEIERTNVEIGDREEEITRHKATMSDLLRELNRYSERTILEVTLSYDRFSSFFDELNSLTVIETELKGGLERVEVLKHELEIKKEDLEGKRTELDAAKQQLQARQRDLEDQQAFHAVLAEQLSQEKIEIEGVLDELKGEARQISGEIVSLEDEFRKKLQTTNQFPELAGAALSWPIAPIQGISAYFHDPTYPFRKIFEHPAIDIPTPQGTPVLAADDGIVAIARKRDWITNAAGKIVAPAYNYVTIIHGDNISTVYGHLSVINVVEETFVRKGTVIGLSGATPGTAGAGRLTTGPHLHLEVRVNGIPDDPLKYLPPL